MMSKQSGDNMMSKLPPVPLFSAPAPAADSNVTKSQRMIKVSAVVLKQIVGLENLDGNHLQGNNLRQMCKGQLDENGEDASGKWVYSDVLRAVATNDNAHARRMSNDKKMCNKEIAPSLAWVTNGSSTVS